MRQVKLIRPLDRIVGLPEASKILLSRGLRRIETPPQTELDVEVRVIQQHIRQQSLRYCGGFEREEPLSSKRRLGKIAVYPSLCYGPGGNCPAPLIVPFSMKGMPLSTSVWL